VDGEARSNTSSVTLVPFPYYARNKDLLAYQKWAYLSPACVGNILWILLGGKDSRKDIASMGRHKFRALLSVSLYICKVI